MNELPGVYNCKLYLKDFKVLWMQEIRSHGSTTVFPDWSIVARKEMWKKLKRERYADSEEIRKKVSDDGKKYRAANPEKVAESKKKYPQSPEKKRANYELRKAKQWPEMLRMANERRRSEKYKIKQREREKARHLSDPGFRLKKNLRRGISGIFKRQGTVKNASVLNLIGLPLDDFMSHIERQFKPWMTWGNYGTKWHLDHILPCASFDHADPAQVAICWHWTNLRPLRAKENLRKSDTITMPQMMLRMES